MFSYLYSFAIKQPFCHLNIRTEAKTKLEQATVAYYKKEITESANLFLKS
jgi:hypothetical protein